MATPDPPSDAAARRPSYVWAQNNTHTFVTVSLTPEERRGALPQVHFASQTMSVAIPETLALSLETYRKVLPAGCGWQITNRGVLLRLQKRTPMHWPRLLKSAGNDVKQGVDWTRWAHPEAEEAERAEDLREEFVRRSAQRERDMAQLRPRFQQALTTFKAVRERGEAMEPEDAKEMIRMGEAILRHYREEREERTALLGDAPLPAGVDEEQLERSLLKLQESERHGQLDYDRNSPSWKEYRRRQRERREAMGLPEDAQVGWSPR